MNRREHWFAALFCRSKTNVRVALLSSRRARRRLRRARGMGNTHFAQGGATEGLYENKIPKPSGFTLAGVRRMRLILTKLAISALITSVFGVPAAPGFAQTKQSLIPGTLAIYYGKPSQVNGSSPNITKAVSVFSRYDNVVFGDALEFPQFTNPPTAGQVADHVCNQNSHVDHDNTVSIIRQLENLGTEVYGYVSIGGEGTARLCGGVPTPLTMSEIKARVDAWAAMKVTGILLRRSGIWICVLSAATNGRHRLCP